MIIYIHKLGTLIFFVRDAVTRQIPVGCRLPFSRGGNLGQVKRKEKKEAKEKEKTKANQSEKTNEKGTHPFSCGWNDYEQLAFSIFM